ncbi:MAG: GYD domain-containing protein [Geobacteraceae bacterium]|nr:GYD domain-containing protein [Geobacteraceae bacterium]
MPTYVILMNLTDQGARNIKDAPARIQAVAKSLEAAGGRMLAFYHVMGPYDYVAITEGPSDELALAQLLALGMAGNVRTTTRKAFSMEAFEDILKKLP